ncbi:hypothetical protein [Sutcliffiella horikoshii]|uniref:hypothetical protein n=1 Tax=Sutcliffiella horikoshii TaxID=79883 RepID=UPI001CFD8B88|nr:hypothetical protein [Sutcliffiella horikoshii]
MMEKHFYIIIAFLILSFPCLAYSEIAHSFPLSSDTISTYIDMQIEPAVQAPSTNGWQNKKMDITCESPPLLLIDIYHHPYKLSINRVILARPHLFLTPYFYQGGYLSLTVI